MFVVHRAILVIARRRANQLRLSCAAARKHVLGRSEIGLSVPVCAARDPRPGHLLAAVDPRRIAQRLNRVRSNSAMRLLVVVGTLMTGLLAPPLAAAGLRPALSCVPHRWLQTVPRLGRMRSSSAMKHLVARGLFKIGVRAAAPVAMVLELDQLPALQDRILIALLLGLVP